MFPNESAKTPLPSGVFSVSDPSENGRDGVMFPIGAIERR
jgi:hypothetical protein